MQRRFIASHRLQVLSLFAILLCAIAFPVSVRAAMDGCRSDPVVYLSDGTVLDVSAEIGTSPQNVSGVHYAIHGPRGVNLVLAVSTPGILFHEDFTYVADANAGEYITVTHADTIDAPAPVTSTTTLLKVILLKRITLTSKPVSGWSGQDLVQVLDP